MNIQDSPLRCCSASAQIRHVSCFGSSSFTALSRRLFLTVNRPSDQPLYTHTDERWYEGRKVFETACARVRELVRAWIVTFPAKTEEERSKQLAACRCAVAYVYSLMCEYS